MRVFPGQCWHNVFAQLRFPRMLQLRRRERLISVVSRLSGISCPHPCPQAPDSLQVPDCRLARAVGTFPMLSDFRAHMLVV